MKTRDSSLAEGWGQIVTPLLYRQLEESKTGKSAISSAKASDYLLPPTDNEEE